MIDQSAYNLNDQFNSRARKHLTSKYLKAFSSTFKMHPNLASTFGVFCIFLHMFLHSVNGRILRRSCGDYANFSYVEQDKVLQGEKITTVIVPSEEECELACVDELQCKSINIEKSKKARRCELNKRSTADASDGVALTPKQGWVYKSTSFTENLIGHMCRKLNPCEPEHLCLDVCYSPGYKCTHCKELPLGMPCVRSISNIAYGKSTSQSSTYAPYSSANAVDGGRTGVWNSGSFSRCMHTGQQRPWWSVDFAGNAVVYSVTIYSRTDCCFERVSGLHVKLGNKNAPNANTIIWTTPTFTSTQTNHMKEFGQPKKGKYLYVESQVDNYLDFCEVEVMGYLE
ncbi:uncharacterized protein LOC135688284 [Rhopilema esculentum]|uniref:uncharacterized protein LOC135688284 n=1 Tax=Rhopilema esculentum TaxID=499914 RepID=UPI0031D2C97A